jgi:hypothetical protein
MRWLPLPAYRGYFRGVALEGQCAPKECPGDEKITADVRAMINQHTDVGRQTQSKYRHWITCPV